VCKFLIVNLSSLPIILFVCAYKKQSSSFVLFVELHCVKWYEAFWAKSGEQNRVELGPKRAISYLFLPFLSFFFFFFFFFLGCNLGVRSLALRHLLHAHSPLATSLASSAPNRHFHLRVCPLCAAPVNVWCVKSLTLPRYIWVVAL
jgi:hypothetical protein